MRMAQRLILILPLTAISLSWAEPQSAMMKAVVLRAYGGPSEGLKLEDVPRPEPKEDEILIVIAASVNPVDVAIRAATAEITGIKFPLTLGMDAAGVVAKVGPDNEVQGRRSGLRISSLWRTKAVTPNT